MYTVCEMDHPFQGGRGWTVIMDTGEARWFATSLREALKTALFLNVRMSGNDTFTMYDADSLIALGYDHEQGVTVCQSIPAAPPLAQAPAVTVPAARHPYPSRREVELV